MPASRRAVLAASLALPLAAACSAPGGSGGPTRITFWSALRGSQQVVDAFNRTQNRIRVDFQQIPSGDQGGYAKLSNAARAGNAPDVATIEYPQVPGFAIDGVARDITDLVSDRLRAKLLPQALRLTTFMRPGVHRALGRRADGAALPRGPVRRADSPHVGRVRRGGPPDPRRPPPDRAVPDRRRPAVRRVRVAGRSTLVRHVGGRVERLARRRRDPARLGVLAGLDRGRLGLHERVTEAGRATRRSGRAWSWPGSAARGTRARR